MPGILGRAPDAAEEFSSSSALPILREACRQAGLASDGAELLRIGENANFQLASAPIVVRISRPTACVTREPCVVRWLAAPEVPALDPRLLGDASPIYWSISGRVSHGQRSVAPRIAPSRSRSSQRSLAPDRRDQRTSSRHGCMSRPGGRSLAGMASGSGEEDDKRILRLLDNLAVVERQGYIRHQDRRRSPGVVQED